MKFVRSIQVACVLAACTSACASPFPAPNLVDRPRVIAVLPSKLIVTGGDTLSARVVFAGTSAATITRWRVCVPARIDPLPEQRCADGEGSVATTQEGGDALRWTLPTDQTELSTLLFAAFVDANGNIPNINTALQSLRTNGAEMLVYVEAVADGGVQLRALKRVLFSLGGMSYTPLASQAFTFAGQRFTMQGDECVPDAASNPVTVAAGSTHRLQREGTTPSGVDGAHFADGGSFPLVFERAGITDWVAPAAGATARHWVVFQRNLPRMSGNGVADVITCSFSTLSR